MSYLTQMLALTVQNFVSAAVGMAIVVALIRGLRARSAQTIGNFWVDLTRSTVYILLPLSLILAVILVTQGVVQNFYAYQPVTLLQATVDGNGNAELFFGFLLNKKYDVTIALRFENDMWREVLREVVRCQG